MLVHQSSVPLEESLLVESDGDQAVSLQAWLRIQRDALCAPPAAVERTNAGCSRFVHVAATAYASLVRAGYEIPLSMAVDLACLYLDETLEEFRPPPSWPAAVGPELARRYCRSLNGSDARCALRRTVVKARMARLTDRGEGPSRHGGGLCTFLELVAGGLYQRAIPEPLPHDVREAFRKNSTEQLAELAAAVTRSEGTSRPAVGGPDGEALAQFLGQLFPTDEAADPGPFTQAFEGPARTPLAVAAAQVPAGAEGLDLPLLQAALEYRPLPLTVTANERWQRFRQMLSPRQLRRSRSPECGNHGISTRGKPTAALRSHMARHDFLERVYLKQVPYIDRRAPRQVPHRVLVAWVLDQGVRLQTRVAGSRRRCSLARQLAASVLEDAARYFADTPALELWAAVVFHNGERQDWRYRVIDLPNPVLRTAPAAAPPRRGSAGIEGWLPNVHGFLPYFFLREPIWPDTPVRGVPSEWADERAPSHRRALMALRGVAAAVELWAPEPTDDHLFDLCHVSLVVPAEETADDGIDWERDQHAVAALAASPVLNYLVCGEREARWVTSPRAHTSEPAPEPGYDQAGLRLAAWDLLLHSLEVL